MTHYWILLQNVKIFFTLYWINKNAKKYYFKNYATKFKCVMSQKSEVIMQGCSILLLEILCSYSTSVLFYHYLHTILTFIDILNEIYFYIFSFHLNFSLSFSNFVMCFYHLYDLFSYLSLDLINFSHFCTSNRFINNYLIYLSYMLTFTIFIPFFRFKKNFSFLSNIIYFTLFKLTTIFF